MTSRAKSEMLTPALLVALSAIPVAAGLARLTKLAAAGPGAAADARFLASPAPVVLHIVTVTAFCVLGAFQFAPSLRRGRGGWHAAAGRVLAPCGLVAALSGLWMTQFYPNAPNGGDLLYGMRLAVGCAMAASILLALDAIRRRDFSRHGAWMIRAYAIGQGAGTQALTGLPWALLVGTPGVTTNALLMGAGWLINIVFAEAVIYRMSGQYARRTPPGVSPAAPSNT
jgi:uncharacterized membrane protein